MAASSNLFFNSSPEKYLALSIMEGGNSGKWKQNPGLAVTKGKWPRSKRTEFNNLIAKSTRHTGYQTQLPLHIKNHKDNHDHDIHDDGSYRKSYTFAWWSE